MSTSVNLLERIAHAEFEARSAHTAALNADSTWRFELESTSFNFYTNLAAAWRTCLHTRLLRFRLEALEAVSAE